ncbi:MAG TPA: methyltransferase domain-containing protein [Fluviicola sp.]|nr:methyltransferase domain-containing protein [Fluviicola sp.]
MSKAGFDAAAKDYDLTFTHTAVGKAQRERVWHYLDRLPVKEQSTVLEVNCGTGEDARRWHEKGYTIVASDLSQQMIATAQAKHPEIDFRVVNLLELDQLDLEPQTIFSNFGGLNCLPEKDLKIFFQKASDLLATNERLICVIMGKKTAWDRAYVTFKGRFNQRNRRNTSYAVEVLVNGTAVSTWYYSPKEIIRLAGSHFDVELLRPVGLFIPPSYMAPFFVKRPRTLRFLIRLEKWFSFSVFANRSDHYFLSLKKR